jgi:hypothetical protein
LTLAAPPRDPPAARLAAHPLEKEVAMGRVLAFMILFPAAVLSEAPPAARGQANQPASAIEKRIIDSPGVTLQAPFGNLALGSFHLEMTARQPRLDAGTKQVAVDEWKLAADLERDNVFVKCSIKEPAAGKTLTIEGWILGEGRPGGVPYEATGGKVDVSPRVQQQCWIRAYAWTPALSAAASGATPAGQETIDGRSAEKYHVEARPKALEQIRTLMNLTSAKGTVWLDRQTGALLKAVIDYQESFTEQRGSSNVIGTGTGRVEMMVIRVGRASVKPPK